MTTEEIKSEIERLSSERDGLPFISLNDENGCPSMIQYDKKVAQLNYRDELDEQIGQLISELPESEVTTTVTPVIQM